MADLNTQVQYVPVSESDPNSGLQFRSSQDATNNTAAYEKEIAAIRIEIDRANTDYQKAMSIAKAFMLNAINEDTTLGVSFESVEGIFETRQTILEQIDAELVANCNLKNTWSRIYPEKEPETPQTILGEDVSVPTATWYSKLIEINARIKKLRDQGFEKKSTEVTVKPSKPIGTDIPRKYPFRNLTQWVYSMELFYIRPDGQKVMLDPFITNGRYTMNYDMFTSFILTLRVVVTDTVFQDFKDYMEALKFFLTVKKTPRNESGDTTKFASQVIFENKPLSVIDPDLEATDSVEAPDHMGATPKHAIVFDLVSSREIQASARSESRVFSNVTLLEVMQYLVDEAQKQTTDESTDTKQILKAIISPPDNDRKYTQIMIEPGNIVQSLYSLQQKYGIYRTGIYVNFNAVHSSFDDKLQKFVVENRITIMGKGETVPTGDNVENVLFEFVPTTGLSHDQFFATGSEIDAEKKLLIVQSSLPYQIEKKNSPRILEGQSLRVMNSGQDDDLSNHCEIDQAVNAAHRVFWSDNDNPFAMTEMQYAIAEKTCVIYTQVRDVDILQLSNNLKYQLAFSGKDDKAYSGEYRLAEVAYPFDLNRAGDKSTLQITASLKFTNIPAVSVNGMILSRETYAEKVAKTKSSRSGSDGTITVTKLPVSTVNIANVPVPASANGPFKVSFAGKKDTYGRVIPDKIDGSFKMSDHVVFSDLYVTKDGIDLKKAIYLTNDPQLFMNAQLFAKTILDPCIAKFGKCTPVGGKFNSLYRYGIPPGGSTTSAHPAALAVDAVWAPYGLPLLEAYKWLVKDSGLPYDQVILEGNGKEWRWIHIGWKVNGTPRLKPMFTMSGQPGTFKYVNLDKFTSASQAEMGKIIQISF